MKPKFVEIYENLTKKEIGEIESLSKISFTDKSRDYSSIFDALHIIKEKYKNSGENDKMEELIKLTGMNRRNLWNRLNELTRLSEYFYALKNLGRNSTLRRSLVLDEFMERNQFDQAVLFEALSKKTLRESNLDSDSFYLNGKVLNTLSDLNLETGNYEKYVSLFRDYSEYSLAAYLLELFRQLLEFAVQEKNNVKHDFNLTAEAVKSINYEALLELIRRNTPQLYPVIEIYHSLYRSFNESETDNDQYYSRAKTLFFNTSKNLAQDIKNDILRSLRNYCIDKTNKGYSVYYEEIFILNNRILEEGLFKGGNVIDSRTNNFRNFIFAASRLEKYDWIKDFIKNYSQELPHDIREDEVNLSGAILSIYEKKFDTALEYLAKIKRKSYLLYLDTGVYKLIVYYEIGEFEESRMEIARLKDYIRQHREIPGYLKLSYQKFITKFSELLKLTEKMDPFVHSKFLTEMEKLKYVGMGGWLYEKATELSKK
jgi:hypothetical protein